MIIFRTILETVSIVLSFGFIVVFGLLGVICFIEKVNKRKGSKDEQ